MDVYLNNRRDELFNKSVFEKVWPVCVNEVDEETLNMRSILILISHYHQL